MMDESHINHTTSTTVNKSVSVNKRVSFSLFNQTSLYYDLTVLILSYLSDSELFNIIRILLEEQSYNDSMLYINIIYELFYIKNYKIITIYKNCQKVSSFTNLSENDLLVFKVNCNGKKKHWMYLTDNNHQTYGISEMICENIVLFGSINSIKNGWMVNNHVIKSIDFCGLYNLKDFDELAIFQCTKLSEIIYMNLSILYAPMCRIGKRHSIYKYDNLKYMITGT